MTAIAGVYGITPELPNSRLYKAVYLAIKGGVRIIQYRQKLRFNNDINSIYDLLYLCRQHNVLFIINDDWRLASKIGADGVHLGQQDGTIDVARQHLKKNSLIGITCHNQLSLAIKAQQQGADYVAFGAFFDSLNKKNSPVCSLEILRQAKKQIQLPSVAIGGINASNATTLIRAGADAIACINGLFTGDIVKNGQVLVSLFAK